MQYEYSTRTLLYRSYLWIRESSMQVFLTSLFVQLAGCFCFFLCASLPNFQNSKNSKLLGTAREPIQLGFQQSRPECLPTGRFGPAVLV